MSENSFEQRRRSGDYFFVFFLTSFFILSILFLAYQNILLLSAANKVGSLSIATSSDISINIQNANISLTEDGKIALNTAKECQQSEAVCDCSDLVSGSKEEVLVVLDTDGDGLIDDDELKYGTDPEKVDTDGDTYSDLLEIQNGYNPLGEGSLTEQNTQAEKTNKNEEQVSSENGGEVLGIQTSIPQGSETSTFDKIKSGVGGFFSGVGDMLKNRFKKQEVITIDNIKNFLGLTDEEYGSFVEIAKREQSDIKAAISSAEAAFREKLTRLLGGEIELSNQEFIWPVPKNKVTSAFHDEAYPFKDIFAHTGVDIRAKQGTPVSASNSGYVAKVVDGGKTGYSYIVVVHGDDITTVYGHLSRIDVKEGQRVSQGELLGLSGGSPGTAGAGKLTTGPHLHFELREKGQPVDPLTYLN